MQNINLLSQLPAPAQDYVTSRNVLLVGVIFFIVLFIFSGFVVVPAVVVKTKLKRALTLKSRLHKQLATLTKQIEQRKNKIKDISDNKKNDGSVYGRELEKLLGHMHTESMSSYFTGLTNAVPYEAWLDSIFITKGGHSIVLKGKALEPKFVTLLLKGLKKNKSFHGRSLNILELTKSKDGVNFELKGG